MKSLIDKELRDAFFATRNRLCNAGFDNGKSDHVFVRMVVDAMESEFTDRIYNYIGSNTFLAHIKARDDVTTLFNDAIMKGRFE